LTLASARAQRLNRRTMAAEGGASDQGFDSAEDEPPEREALVALRARFEALEEQLRNERAQRAPAPLNLNSIGKSCAMHLTRQTKGKPLSFGTLELAQRSVTVLSDVLLLLRMEFPALAPAVQAFVNLSHHTYGVGEGVDVCRRRR